MNQTAARQNPGHAHQPLVGLTICFGLGILLEENARIPFFVYSFLAVTAIAAGFLFMNKPRASIAAMLAAFLFLGAVHALECKTFPPDHISRVAAYGYRAPVLVEGVVSSDVENRRYGKLKKTIFRLEVRRIRSYGHWEKVSGEVLVNLFRDEPLRYGDYAAIEGKLHRPFTFSVSGPDKFSYRDYLHRQGIDLILSVKKQGKVEVAGHGRANPFYARVLGFKHRLEAILAEHFSGVALGIMQGFMLGDRYNIPEYVYELFKISGVAHIIAISGFNISIVAYVTFLFVRLFPCGRKGHYFLTMVILVLYAILTGAQPPVVRATIMACVFLTGFILEREVQTVNTLACAALVILWMNPQNLFDVGFQLSFVSVLSIVLIYPGLVRKEERRSSIDKGEPQKGGAPRAKARGTYDFPPVGRNPVPWNVLQDIPGIKSPKSFRFQGTRRPFIHGLKSVAFWVQGKTVAAAKAMGRYIGQSFALSCSAYFGVAILIAYYFQTVTPVALLANLVVIPLSSLIVVLGLGFFLTGLALPAAAFLFAHCLNVLLALMIGAIALCVRIPGAYFRVPGLPVYAVVIFYAVSGLALFFWRGDFLSRRKDH